jgi:3-oxoacyl-[acyl-carrier protein] reductase
MIFPVAGPPINEMTRELMKRSCIVLGGGSGIGRATVERFAREDCRVVVAGPDADQLENVLAGLPGEGHLAIRTDVTKDADLENLCLTVKNSLGGFDVLVNSVGVSRKHGVVDSDFRQWDNSLQVMLYGAVRACRKLVPLLQDGGRIIHITSIHYMRVAAGSSAYGMAKAALTQFTRSLALELADRGILANAIAPGFVDTPMSVKEDGASELESEWFRSHYVRGGHLPLKRAARPEEIAGAVWFLAGPDASYITGSVLTVDGGLTITF